MSRFQTLNPRPLPGFVPCVCPPCPLAVQKPSPSGSYRCGARLRVRKEGRESGQCEGGGGSSMSGGCPLDHTGVPPGSTTVDTWVPPRYRFLLSVALCQKLHPNDLLFVCPFFPAGTPGFMAPEMLAEMSYGTKVFVPPRMHPLRCNAWKPQGLILWKQS